ncbi:MAG TPA: hypothetical protein VJU59_28305 [Paraburkholderia sp.]|uniref:hypothetical protein n=1 Tax=Paraburkholderia sp. TaxID=1926495 RepID=UPI002B4A7FB5|nr:hypothetical protein [Paraburkholderia sp.]HKR43538.1 hypothetical protein [Paraburkholderia sp.]
MEAPENAKNRARSNAAGGIGHFGQIRERKVRRKSGKFPADSLWHALRRERRAENRRIDGFSTVSSFYKDHIALSTAK